MSADPTPPATPHPALPPDTPIILFDGVCNLCNASIQWIIRRDHRQRFRFASLQSPFARRTLAALAPESTLPDSVVLILPAVPGAPPRILLKSAAALGIARRLGPPWSLAAIFWIIPRPIRDHLYAWVARNRYRWFGKQDACMVPTPALRARFLDA